MIGVQRLNSIINSSCKTAFQRSKCLSLSNQRQLKNLVTKSVCTSFTDRCALRQPRQSTSFNAKWFSSTTADKNESSSTEKEETATHEADGKVDYGYVGGDGRFDGHKPTIVYAKSMPCDYPAMRHEQIIQLSIEGDYGARKEALTRNVMAVDGVKHEEAEKVVAEIKAYNHKSMMWVHTLPYKAGFVSAMAGGILSFPLIFHANSVKWFNEVYVTTDVPSVADLETPLEVAMWSWNWMEPICGQVSFVLLVLQFARAQLKNLGLRPFGDKMKQIRGDRLVKKYPKYNELFIRWYSDEITMFGA